MSRIEREATPEEMAAIEAEVKAQIDAANLRCTQGKAPLRIREGGVGFTAARAADDDAPAPTPADDDAPAPTPADDDAPTPAPGAIGIISNASYYAALKEYIAAFPWDNDMLCPRIMNGFLRYALAGIKPKDMPFLHLHVTGGGEKERGDLYRFITRLFKPGEIVAVLTGANVAAVNAAMEATPGARLLMLKDAEPILPALPYLVKRHMVGAVLSLHEHTAVDDLKELPDNAVELHMRPYIDEAERALMADSIHAAELNTARGEALQAIKNELDKPLARGTAAETRAAHETLLARVRNRVMNTLAIDEGEPAPGLAQYAERTVKEYFSSNMERCCDNTNAYYDATYTIWALKPLRAIYAAGDTPDYMYRPLIEYAKYMRAKEIERGAHIR